MDSKFSFFISGTLKIINFFFIALQTIYWSQFFWLIPAIFPNFFANTSFSVIITLSFLMLLRGFAYSLIKTSEFSGDMLAFSNNNDFQEIRACKICQVPKNKKIHHCSLCNSCILKLDHHSLLTGNCIGKNNYKYFMSYVFYAFINAGFLMFLSGADLWRLATFDFKNISVTITRLLLMNFFSFFVFWVALFWLVFQIYCICNDVTFLEIVNIGEMYSIKFSVWQIFQAVFFGKRREELISSFKKTWFSYFENYTLFSILYPTQNKSKKI